MARLVPSEFESMQQQLTKHSAEVRTLERLRDGLSDQYTIYHGVHWARAQTVGSAYGEIDFILASAYGRLLAIEQKDTQIIPTDTDLYAQYTSNGNHRKDRHTDLS